MRGSRSGRAAPSTHAGPGAGDAPTRTPQFKADRQLVPPDRDDLSRIVVAPVTPLVARNDLHLAVPLVTGQPFEALIINTATAHEQGINILEPAGQAAQPEQVKGAGWPSNRLAQAFHEAQAGGAFR